MSSPVEAQAIDGDVTLAPRFWVPLGLTLIAALVLAGTPRWGGAPWFGLTLYEARLWADKKSFSASNWSGSSFAEGRGGRSKMWTYVE